MESSRCLCDDQFNSLHQVNDDHKCIYKFNIPADVFPLATDTGNCPPYLLLLTWRDIFDRSTDDLDTNALLKQSLSLHNVSGGAVADRAIIGTEGTSEVMR